MEFLKRLFSNKKTHITKKDKSVVEEDSPRVIQNEKCKMLLELQEKINCILQKDAYIARSRHSQQVAAPVQKVTVQSSLLYGDTAQKQPLIISGQDVILDILSNYLHQYGIQALRAYVGSFESLLSLYQGNVQAATCHLWDSDTDSYNLPYIRRLMPGVHAVAVNLTYRMQGFYVKRSVCPLLLQGGADCAGRTRVCQDPVEQFPL